jgi:tRNA-uridine 2-sulfurtransferase
MSEPESIAVAMSGGVDSCVSAALLVSAGYRVFGVTAILTGERSRCCSAEDICIAQEVCRQLGIEHHLVDVRETFERTIIGQFTSEYLAGRTPSPCALCNPLIKFGLLMDRALEMGASRLATGHYARLTTAPDGSAHLLRGMDARKDQSYFLALLPRERLALSMFPVGDLQKRQVGQIAAERDLAARKSRESQEVCFVPDGSHGEWMDVRCFDTKGPGPMVDAAGRVLGQHRGIHHYTVGQRRGLGVAVGAPLYVVAIDAAANRVVVGTREQSLRDSMTVRDLSWIAGVPPACEFDAAVQIRHNHQAAPCRITLGDDGAAAVRFQEPQFAVAPGQLAAFYAGDEVLGGGWIG